MLGLRTHEEDSGEDEEPGDNDAEEQMLDLLQEGGLVVGLRYFHLNKIYWQLVFSIL